MDIVLYQYQLTPEAYRLKFKTASKNSDETFEEFTTRLELYLRRWLKPDNDTTATQDANSMFELSLID